MKRWVVTGPAGAGKSVLCGFLARGGAAILDGDRLGHEILARPEIAGAVAAEFGSLVIRDGSVDRAILGRLVFGDRSALERLNDITHGPLSDLVAEKLNDVQKSGRHRLAVLEAAVYFLLPPVPGVELVITVTASDTTREKRLRDFAGLDRETARSRIRAQRPLEDGWARADIVLVNEGPLGSLGVEAAALLARLDD
ncbi:MAG: dephospho-CoA kinase [Candidatus Krumholzibacteriota bacterium]